MLLYYKGTALIVNYQTVLMQNNLNLILLI
nr:MAG TPA: hypothetical protein [Crassvirales sp.]